jgi:hypothetical protein
MLAALNLQNFTPETSGDCSCRRDQEDHEAYKRAELSEGEGVRDQSTFVQDHHRDVHGEHRGRERPPEVRLSVALGVA